MGHMYKTDIKVLAWIHLASHHTLKLCSFFSFFHKGDGVYYFGSSSPLWNRQGSANSEQVDLLPTRETV